MHIPDGFLDARTALATAVLAAAGLGLALRDARRHLAAAKVPLLGLSAAFVFAAQMINFPVGAGTSGHLLGGVLTAALLGPAAAVIVLSCVLILQCLLFADGGVTSLGANIFNMAIVGGVLGWVIYALLGRLMPGLSGKITAAVVAAWASTVLAAIACAGELAASGTVSWGLVFPTMTWTHMLIGIGEGIITAAVLTQIAAVRRDLVMQEGAAEVRSYGVVAAFGLLACVGLALFVAPFACPLPDGLDWVAETLGFKGTPVVKRPLVEYSSTVLAGGIGTLAAFGVGWMTARVLAPRENAVRSPG